MEDMQQEIQNLWRKVVSEMHHALSDNCIMELQQCGVLEVRYHKFHDALQGTIDAIREFTKPEPGLMTRTSNPVSEFTNPAPRPMSDLPPNPFDVENLPQIQSYEPPAPPPTARKSVVNPEINEVKNSTKVPAVLENKKNLPLQQVSNSSFVRNNSPASASLMSSSENSRQQSGEGNSPCSNSGSYHTPAESETMRARNPYRYGNIRNLESLSHPSQNSGNLHDMHSGGDDFDTYRPKSSKSFTLTYASLSPAKPMEDARMEDRSQHTRSNTFETRSTSALSQRRETMQRRREEDSEGATKQRAYSRAQSTGHLRDRSHPRTSTPAGSFRPSLPGSHAANYRRDVEATNDYARRDRRENNQSSGFFGFPDTQRRRNSTSGRRGHNYGESGFANAASDSGCISSSNQGRITYPVENVFKMFEPSERLEQPEVSATENLPRNDDQRLRDRKTGSIPSTGISGNAIVVPAPDFTYDSSEDDDDDDELVEEEANAASNSHGYRGARNPPKAVIRPDPSSIYAKKGDLIPHKVPPFKQLINVRVTYTDSQRSFYVTFINEEAKYRSLARDIYEENYDGLVGRKVEEGQPCMVYKDGQYYRAILESIGATCHAFLVDFGGYLMVPKRNITPMLLQHAELPMAAIPCSILEAFRAELPARHVQGFKDAFPINSEMKLLFVRQSKHGGTYETHIYVTGSTRHEAFLPKEAYY